MINLNINLLIYYDYIHFRKNYDNFNLIFDKCPKKNFIKVFLY